LLKSDIESQLAPISVELLLGVWNEEQHMIKGKGKGNPDFVKIKKSCIYRSAGLTASETGSGT
jgi:hypothetical protein